MPQSSIPLTVVIPVYNEGANFKALWGEISSSIQTPFSAIVVYDFDADNTLPVVKEVIAAGETRLTLLRTLMDAALRARSRPAWKRWSRGRCW